MNKTPIIIPIQEIASEFVERLSVYGSLKLNTLMCSIITEDVLYNAVGAYLEDALNPLIRNKTKDREVEDKIELLANSVGIKVNDLEKILFSSFGYKYMFALLEQFVSGGEWDVYRISKVNGIYVLEYVGNYVYMEWEKDHVRDGVYSKIPYVSKD